MLFRSFLFPFPYSYQSHFSHSFPPTLVITLAPLTPALAMSSIFSVPYSHHTHSHGCHCSNATAIQINNFDCISPSTPPAYSPHPHNRPSTPSPPPPPPPPSCRHSQHLSQRTYAHQKPKKMAVSKIALLTLVVGFNIGILVTLVLFYKRVGELQRVLLSHEFYFQVDDVSRKIYPKSG